MARAHISRRAVLGGGSALAIGLPLLEAMAPRQARAGGGGDPRRFLAFFTPNGMPMNRWTPTNQGPGYDLPPALEGLADIQDQVSVLTGLQNSAVNGSAGHAPSTAGFLTGTPVADSQTDLSNTSSVDQVYAQFIAGQSPINSLALGLLADNGATQCDASNYGCAYIRNISWNGSTPIPKLTTPQAAFDLLFAGYDGDASSQQLAIRRAKRLSLLDGVRGEAEALRSKMGATDRQKLDEYLTAVRDLEQRVESEELGGVQACMAQAPAVPTNIESKVLATLDVIALAFKCDRTRSVTLMCGEGLNSLDFSHLGISTGHHTLSHALGVTANAADYLEIARWEVRMFVELLQRLAAIPEGDHTVLDSTIAYFGNEISEGYVHSHVNLPVLLAGGAALGLSPGRHVVYGNQPPIADLFIGVLAALGVDVPSFGAHGTAALSQL